MAESREAIGGLTRELIALRVARELSPGDVVNLGIGLPTLVANFIDDEVGVRNRDVIGVDNIMWSSDYPHVNSTWPRSRESIARHFAGVPDDERQKMICGNVARLYGL